eukprot:COSAG02_NODE_3210_length_7165_cov_3.703510_5_plen_117_part_01
MNESLISLTDDTAAATAAAGESGADAVAVPEDQRRDIPVDKLSPRNQLQDLSLQLTNASLLGDEGSSPDYTGNFKDSEEPGCQLYGNPDPYDNCRRCPRAPEWAPGERLLLAKRRPN